jgi:DNA polymerase-3 subunit beta
LELTVSNPDHGTAREELPVSFEAEPFEIGFNARYLMDIAEQIHTESATFLFADSGSPTLIKSEDEPDALYVLMPMRV